MHYYRFLVLQQEVFYVSWDVCQLSYVPGRCFLPRELTPLLLRKLDSYQEAYGSDDTSALNFRFTGLY